MKTEPTSNFWRPLASLALILVLGEGVLRPSVQGQSVTKEAVLKDILHNVITPGYRELALKCKTLATAAEQLALAPTPEQLEATREAWLAALLAARQVQWWPMGPIADREYLAAFYYAKVLPGRIADVLKSSRVLDETHLEELAATTKGLFAMENLLYEAPTELSANAAKSAMPVPKEFFDTNGQRRCQFLVVLAADVSRKAEMVSQDWAGNDPQGAARKFMTGGQASLSLLVNELAAVVEKVAESHLNFSLQLPTPILRQLDRIEGARSRSTRSQLAAILRGAQAAYRGGEGQGIDDYLRPLNQPLAVRIEAGFEKSFASLKAIEVPLEVALTDQRELVERAYQTVRELELLFKTDLAGALGVTITFTSDDGD